jgi:hypothetical protein
MSKLCCDSWNHSFQCFYYNSKKLSLDGFVFVYSLICINIIHANINIPHNGKKCILQCWIKLFDNTNFLINWWYLGWYIQRFIGEERV